MRRVVYIYGSLPMFQHEEGDLQSFRLFTSQLIDSGAARQVDIVSAFGVPLPTVRRYLKLLRDRGPKAFFLEPKRRSASKRGGAVRKQAQWRRIKAMLGAASLDQPISDPAVTQYQFQQGQLQEQSEHLQRELEVLKAQRKEAPHHVLVKDLPEEFRFTRLRSERKHFLDTIKMLSYRAETSMVSIVREKLARSDDGRALLRQIFETEVDLIPDLPQHTLTVRLRHLTQRARDDVIRLLV